MKLKELINFGIGMAFLYLFFHLIGVGCPIKWFTGISCAGCGMSRAWLALLSGNVSEAFLCHPLFWIPPFAVLALLFKNKINDRIFRIIMLTFAIAFITIYVYRMIFDDSGIVVFEPQNGIIARIISVLF